MHFRRSDFAGNWQTIPMQTYKDLPMRAFSTVEEWRNWLEEHHEHAAGIWVMTAKKGSGVTTMSYEEGRDTAIAFGWIDGLINRYDDTYYLTRYTQRTKKSKWSKINRDVAEGLMAAGLMHDAGLRHVEAAKKDGRWDLAYDSQATMAVPNDFQSALNDSPIASEYFASLSSANRYSFLYRIQTEPPSSRNDRIRKLIAMLEAGRCFHPTP